MKIILNIEYPLGISMTVEHIEAVKNMLNITDNSSVEMNKRFNGSWFWILNDVDKEVYLKSIKDITEYFTDLHNKGYIQYFYIGEYK